ncbi:uncharacterized protein LOC122793057 [Protopterus annectens]|uniref:uncharacterized protein LOC122793057 n=1 Tax=Protopterus annectens TaxID=7888 RepID=UPI001CF94645|nr:uncharacterized protein LOC122793057 [Protopterus annectens]
MIVLVLNKGLSFIPATKLDLVETILELKMFVRNVMLKTVFMDEHSASNDGNVFKKPSTFIPDNSPAMEAFINLSEDDLRKDFSGGSKSIFFNLSCKEYEALNSLVRDEHLIIRLADKGIGIVVLDKQVYMERMYDMLRDRKVYAVLQKYQENGIIDRLNFYLYDMLMTDLIDYSLYTYFCVEHPTIPVIYGLPKIVGVAMGTACANTYANLVLANWEKEIVFNNDSFKENITFYKHFVDDDDDDDDTENEKTAKTFIMESFPNRNCFVFVQPTTSELIANCSMLENTSLNAKFFEQSEAFCQHIYNKSKVKCLCGEEVRNGEVLAGFIHLYVNYINSGNIPLYKDVVQTLSATVNAEMIEKAFKNYKQQMKAQSNFVTETEQELEEIHKQNMDSAVAAFRKGCFRDNGDAENKLKHAINECYQECRKRNEEQSCKLCEFLLKSLFKDIDQQFRSKYCAKQDGYQLYLQHRDRAIQNYNETTGLGVMKQKSLDSQMEKENDREGCILKEAVQMNENAKDKAITNFVNGMKMIQIPTDTVEMLDDAYQEHKEKSFEIFRTQCSNYQRKENKEAIKREIHQYYEDLQIRNKQESDERCEEACRMFFMEIEDKFQSKSYYVPGGYKAYRQDYNTATVKYKQTPMLGISKQRVLELQIEKERKRELQIYQEEENEKALFNSKELYRTKMCNVRLPCGTAERLKDIHNKYKKEAIECCRSVCFLDEEKSVECRLRVMCIFASFRISI